MAVEKTSPVWFSPSVSIWMNEQAHAQRKMQAEKAAQVLEEPEKILPVPMEEKSISPVWRSPSVSIWMNEQAHAQRKMQAEKTGQVFEEPEKTQSVRQASERLEKKSKYSGLLCSVAPWLAGTVVVAGVTGVAACYLYPDTVNEGVEWVSERIRRRIVRNGILPTSISQYLPTSARDWLYDTPDGFGTTEFQRLARDGHVRTVQQLMSGIPLEEITTNASFTPEMVKSITSDKGQEILNKLDLFHIDWNSNLEVSQNFGVTSVRLITGELYRIPGMEAREVYNQLLQKQYGDSAVLAKAGNVFTAFLNPTHAFMDLQKADGFSERMGMYPDVEKPHGIFGYVIRGLQRLVNLENGSLPQLLLSKHTGYLSKEPATSFLSDSKNHLKVLFVLNDEQAQNVQAAMASKTQALAEGRFDELPYDFANKNCIDFVQRIFEKGAGYSGRFIDHITTDQFRAHHGWNPFSNQAVEASFAMSQGIFSYASHLFK